MEKSRELKGFYSIFVLLVIGKTIKRCLTQSVLIIVHINTID
jgi:hypothetical protein